MAKPRSKPKSKTAAKSKPAKSKSKPKATVKAAKPKTRAMANPVRRLENEEVRITEWQFDPGAETGHHRHEYDYVVVPLTDGLLRLISADGEAKAQLKQGIAYFRKAGVEHNVINGGKKYLAFVEVELIEHPG